MSERTLFIFRRDLRLEDNTGLLFALKNAKEVILSFIFTPEQIDNNPFRGDHCLQFMIESLEDLESEIQKKNGKLYLFYGKPEQIVQTCIEKLKVDTVVVNKDYTPYSIQRDKHIASVCKNHGATFHSFEDLLLHPINDTLKANGQPYTIFTPYFQNASKLQVAKPQQNKYAHYHTKPIPFAEDASLYKKILPERKNLQKGGRKEALKLLKSLDENSGSSHLSPHLKFTTCSVREVYHAAPWLIRSLYWRDFFTSIAYHHPEVYKGAFKPKFNHLKWNTDKKTFTLWCEGKTGFPIVDAAMRDLNETGTMPNRLRMIVASFLVKDLHINWQWGEKHFAQKLIDYDPAVNNGNWQWAASTGCDAVPYFRIFNPWTQGLKFDPDCTYIKQWIPELAPFSPKEIHNWRHAANNYPAPIVDHSEEAKITLKTYQAL